MRFYFVFLFLVTSTFAFSQKNPDRLFVFEEKFKRLFNENKKDSLFIAIVAFEKNTALSLTEQQSLQFHYGMYNKVLSKHKVAIKFWFNCLDEKYSSTRSKKLIQKIYYHLSDSYFTIQDHDKANFYAKLAVRDLTLSEENCNRFIDLHSIIGFYEFKQTNYELSKKQYFLAEEAAQKFSPCKVSEVKYKIAKIYSKLNDFDKAVTTINQSIQVADSCHEKINKLNALRSYRDILLENNKIEKANRVYSEIETLMVDIENKENLSKYDSLETAYKTKFKDQENKALKALNFQKGQVLEKQKWALVATFFGLLLLAGLLFFLFLLSKRQKKTNLELKNQKTIIEENNKDLVRLNLLNQKIFSVISHDFTGPITTLKLLLSKEEIAKTQNPLIASYLNEIYSQLELSEAMLQNLLDWAKTELQYEDHTTDITNVYDGIEVVKNQLIKNISEKNISVNSNVEKYLEVQFPTSIFSIVFRNVLTNAIKFSPENSIIEIYFENNTLNIQDFGVGIDSKRLEKLFKQNINPRLGTHYETGYGLGLYLSSELMLKNKGRITAINNTDKPGCTFKIHFPEIKVNR